MMSKIERMEDRLEDKAEREARRDHLPARRVLRRDPATGKMVEPTVKAAHDIDIVGA